MKIILKTPPFANLKLKTHKFIGMKIIFLGCIMAKSIAIAKTIVILYKKKTESMDFTIHKMEKMEK